MFFTDLQKWALIFGLLIVVAVLVSASTNNNSGNSTLVTTPPPKTTPPQKDTQKPTETTQIENVNITDPSSAATPTQTSTMSQEDQKKYDSALGRSLSVTGQSSGQSPDISITDVGTNQPATVTATSQEQATVSTQPAANSRPVGTPKFDEVRTSDANAYVKVPKANTKYRISEC